MQIVVGIVAILLVLGFLFFFPLQAPEKQAPEKKDDFSNGLFKLNNVWISAGIDLEKPLSEEELLALDETELNSAKSKFLELKESFTSDELKQLSEIYSMFAEDFLLRKQLLSAIKAISASPETVCADLTAIDSIIEINKKLYDKKIEYNIFIKDFIIKFPEQADKADLVLFLIDEDEAFWDWHDIEKNALDLKENCLKGELA